jgi:hypothetical protein
MGSFILFVLWMVGLIVVSIELWGPTGSVNGNCNLYVDGQQSTGASLETLAWLEQHSICKWFLLLCPVMEILESVQRVKGKKLTTDYRPKLDCGMGIPARRMRIPIVDDDYGISSRPRRLVITTFALSALQQLKQSSRSETRYTRQPTNICCT